MNASTFAIIFMVSANQAVSAFEIALLGNDRSWHLA